MSTNATLMQLIEDFISQAKEWAEYLEEGNAKVSNKIFDKTKKTEKKIKQYGELGEKEIWKLMESDNKGVRYWAATSSIRYDPSKSLLVLKKLNEGKGAVSMSAYTTLYLYESGEIEIP